MDDRFATYRCRNASFRPGVTRPGMAADFAGIPFERTIRLVAYWLRRKTVGEVPVRC